jgi:hypothetical protein
MRTVLIALALIVAAPAWAGDCAKYTNDLAYNACLASQGPKARGIPVGASPAARGRHFGAAPTPRRRVFARSRRGRSSMVFSVAK